MTQEERLLKAQTDYPVGTRIIGAYRGRMAMANESITAEDNQYPDGTITCNVVPFIRNNIQFGWHGTVIVYDPKWDKWAKTI